MIGIILTLKDTNALNLWEAVRGNIASSRVTVSEKLLSEFIPPTWVDVTIRAPATNTGNIIGDGTVVNTDPPSLLKGDSQFYPGRFTLAGIFLCATVANDVVRLELGAGGAG